MIGMLLDRHDDEQRAADYRAGLVAALIYNAHRDVKKDKEGKAWDYFFPQWREPPKPQTSEQMFSNAMLWVQVMQRRKEVRG